MQPPYRARLKADAEGRANFETADADEFILAEERTFLRQVEMAGRAEQVG